MVAGGAFNGCGMSVSVLGPRWYDLDSGTTYHLHFDKMSTLKATATSSVSSAIRRLSLGTKEEDSDDKNIVYDEQEQDELIEKLREQNIKMNRQYKNILGIMSGGLAVSNLITSRINLFISTLSFNPAIPSLTFTLLLSITSFLLLPYFRSHKIISNLPDSSLAKLLMTCSISSAILSLVCVWNAGLSFTDSEFWWWCLPTLTFGFSFYAIKIMMETEKGVVELEGLKYKAKGA
ncbi:hypothetical protein BKA69DRAFT_790367 [Paraphysoderma sedebokerense]|nr:hypothetical protein BKA69DRAFT_1122773 [Paraphysoderma sedebokerense]KAI9144407.1 hypothetical protein BKA69DRAFT_790367 [Paraphysoderma sedebokerense]